MTHLKKPLFAMITAMVLATAFASLSPALANEELSEGTIRKIDMEAGKITIKHGPLDNLSMPPMTMIFTVPDPAMLEGFTAGDAIEFIAVDEGGKMIARDIQAAP